MNIYLSHKLLLSGFNPVHDEHFVFHIRDGECEEVQKSSKPLKVNPTKKILLLPGRIITCSVFSLSKDTFESAGTDLQTAGLGVAKLVTFSGSRKASSVFFKKPINLADKEALIEISNALQTYDVTLSEYRTKFF